jgi:uncharacterized YigZ family protein
MSDRYSILASNGEGLYREKGSKFFGFAFPVEDAAAFEQGLNDIKKQHAKARHFCYAYRISDDEWRANDDGEPRHSAGTPILRQIQSAELYETAVVVVRYFGGTKLGVPGLINAYGTAAADALNTAPTTSTFPTKTLRYTLSYPAYNHALHLLNQYDGYVKDQQMTENVVLTIRIREAHSQRFDEALKMVKN